MANQPAVEPVLQKKNAAGGAQLTNRPQHVAQQNKAGQPIEHSVEKNFSYLCSAYLAERGCLSPTNPVKQNTA